MKKYLLPESGNFYKANLHCHTKVSDGAMTPEEVKASMEARAEMIRKEARGWDSSGEWQLAMGVTPKR